MHLKLTVIADDASTEIALTTDASHHSDEETGASPGLKSQCIVNDLS